MLLTLSTVLVPTAQKGENRNGRCSEQHKRKDRLLCKERLSSAGERQLSEDTSSMDTVGKDQLLTVSSNTGARRTSKLMDTATAITRQ